MKRAQQKKKVMILGSTGSIGKNTLDVIQRNKSHFTVTGLSANHSWKTIAQQAEKFRVQHLYIKEEAALTRLKTALGGRHRRFYGSVDLEAFIDTCEADIIVCAISGAAALPALIHAIKKRSTIALANKEALVMAGHIVMKMAKTYNTPLIPVDSEHSGLFQIIHPGNKDHIKKVIITASGGPFVNMKVKDFARITKEDALKHPKWTMGNKITIDSATLINKALEIIEAQWLFGIDADRIEVLIHPEAIVHSLVELNDGAIIAQMAQPDMKIPIQLALFYPDRAHVSYKTLDLARARALTFSKPDTVRFPSLKLGYEVAKRRGTTGAVLVGADEEVVKLFLENKIKFTEMYKIIRKVMDRHTIVVNPTMEEIFNANEWARQEVYTCF